MGQTDKKIMQYREPSFSPDGDRIAYTLVTGEGCSIWVVRPDNNERKQIPNGSRESNPVWSPDGKNLAYLSFPDEYMDLCVTNLLEEKVLIHGKAGKSFANPFGMMNRITWAPDSNSIACVAERNGHTDLLLVRLNGNTEWLTNNREFKLNPAFSPDGARLAYESAKVVPAHGWFWPHVIILELKTELTTGNEFSMAPSWSPDGKNIGFAIRKPGPSNSRIWIADADGSNKKQLSDDSQWEGGPIIWHPAGNKILYDSMEGGINIWEIDLASKAKRRLTEDNDKFRTFYSYNSDGSKILYCSQVNALHLIDLCTMMSNGAQKATLLHGNKIDAPLIKKGANFSFKDIDGRNFNISDFNTISVMAFMNIGCIACASQIESLKRIEKRYGSDVAIIVIGVWQTTSSASKKCSENVLREWKDETKVGWLFAKSNRKLNSCLMQNLPRPYHKFGTVPTPSIMVIDREGFIRYVYPALTPSIVLENVIDRLMQ